MEYREGNMIDGRYRLEQFIGSGSFGEVWVAVDTRTDLEVAIKIYISMDKHGLEEFTKEFQVSFDLNQTNLLHSNYLGVNAEDNRAYLIMPYCPDGSVSRLIGRMSEKDLWKFINDVASGLAYLHGQNPPIIHQDIKPDNILISRTGDYLITDFGISRQVRNTLRRSARSASVAGAPAYMGPERYSSSPMPVKASDIWSLGATIYELATGELPFCGMGGVMQKNGADMTLLPDHYSEEFRSLVYSCLSLETWDRPSAKQLAEEAARQMHSLEVTGTTAAIDKVKEEPSVSCTPNEDDKRKTQIIQTSDANTTSRSEVPMQDSPKGITPAGVVPPEGKVFGGVPVPTEHKSTFSPIVWIATSAAGLLLGFLLNVLV
jgi:serine/threonine protein kinase